MNPLHLTLADSTQRAAPMQAAKKAILPLGRLSSKAFCGRSSS